MSNNINNKNERAYDFKAKSRALLVDYYAIAKEMVGRARVISDSGEDIRSNKERPGILTIMAVAEKAIGEIVRLTPLCGQLDEKTADSGVILGWEYPQEQTRDA